MITAVHVANALAYELDANRNGGAASEIDHTYLAKLGLTNRLPIWREICRDMKNEEGVQ